MLGVGDVTPTVRIFTTPYESVTVAELAAGKPILLLFLLFAWSST